jgi:hypothetical protein
LECRNAHRSGPREGGIAIAIDTEAGQTGPSGNPSSRKRLVSTVLCGGALLSVMCAVVWPQSATQEQAAYYEGKAVRFVPSQVEHARELVVGGISLGPLFSDQKPKDRRPNLYVVCPGTQYHGTDEKGLAFNIVLSLLPRNEDATNWDVYWAIVLDPALEGDLRSERDLLMAAQGLFAPSPELAFEEIPGAGLLREKLRFNAWPDLAPFRQSDGSLPRLLIAPSRLVIRATIGPETPSVTSRLSRALSHLAPHKNSAASDSGK